MGVAGCSTKPANSGQACTRSAQCAEGLACIERRCSDDLAPLRDQSTVPMLMEEEEPPMEPQSGEAAPPPVMEPQSGESAPPPVAGSAG